jgi:superfamily II RNA helicase
MMKSVPLLLVYICMYAKVTQCHAFQASTFPSSPKSWRPTNGPDHANSDAPNSNANSASADARSKHKNKITDSSASADHDSEWISSAQELLAGFFPFALDDWQLYSGGAICSGYNVVVSAPTGAG